MIDQYKIDEDKFREIAPLVKEFFPNATDEQIKDFILADWHEEDHQDWLDSAEAEDIADWVISSRPF